jgi:nucleoside-diphosphate-sugar epimerase
MRVLVTGGCGYIGSALVPRLQEASGIAQVTLLDNLSTGSPANLAGADLGRDDLSFREGDVREYGDVEAAMRDIDAVIHLAAITGAGSTHDREAETRAVNRRGTENILKAARKFDVEHVVFASSCNNYGRAESREIDETVEPDPINPYAQAKYESERLLADYADSYGMETTALRMSTNYGYAPGVRFNLVVNAFVFRALTSRPLTVYGDGSNWRPFIHVEDAARSFLAATTRPDQWPQRVYNVGANSENYRIETMADIVDDELGRNLDISYLREKQPGPSYHVNFDRLEETEFELEWSLPAGVADLAARLGPVQHAPDGTRERAQQGETDV